MDEMAGEMDALTLESMLFNRIFPYFQFIFYSSVFRLVRGFQGNRIICIISFHVCLYDIYTYKTSPTACSLVLSCSGTNHTEPNHPKIIIIITAAAVAAIAIATRYWSCEMKETEILLPV